jgi:hypothetical protein
MKFYLIDTQQNTSALLGDFGDEVAARECAVDLDFLPDPNVTLAVEQPATHWADAHSKRNHTNG